MRRTLLALITILFTAPLLAGCGGDSPAETSAPEEKSSPDASRTPAASDRIPDGNYSKVATIADADELGLPDAVAQELLGPGGETTFTLRFSGDQWSQLQTGDAGPEVGDFGTLAYDAEGKLVTTSGNDQSTGYVATFDWQLDGDELTLTLVEPDSRETPEDVLIGRFITEGTYVMAS